MSAYRSRRAQKTYDRHIKTEVADTCVFCSVKAGDDQLIRQTASFNILANIFPYSIWDGQTVLDHLLVSPKAHTDSLSHLTDEQKVEYVNILQTYETQGYNVYARAPHSPIKSIVHQHTHLIKTEGGAKRFMFLMRKPYIRVVR